MDMTAIRKLFAGLPRLISIAAGTMLACLVLLVVFGENAFSHAYQNQSPIPSFVAGAAGLGAGALLMMLGAREKERRERPVWQIALLFGLVLMVQFVVAHSCWFRLGWDPGASHTAAEEIARGLPLSMPEYFRLCPNNAPLTLLLAIPLWVAVKIGLAVPYVVLPYIDAALLNGSAFLCVLCVRKLTANTVARFFALVVSIFWIALSPYILYPYTDTFSILFPVLALYIWLSIRKPVFKWFLISLVCFMGASIKPTVLIALIALVGLGICQFLAQRPEKGWWKRAAALVAAVVLGMIPGQVYQKASTTFVAGSAVPQEQLSMTHYLMLGMNERTYGGHSQGDVDFSQSYETLDERQKANLERAWERVSERSLKDNIKFFVIKAYKAYSDGSFASHSSFLPVDVPERSDPVGSFLCSLYHQNGRLMPICQAVAHCLWMMLLGLCAAACFRRRKQTAISVLGLAMIGLTAYLLLFEVWPRYLFLFAPYFVILSAMALVKHNDPVVK